MNDNTVQGDQRLNDDIEDEEAYDDHDYSRGHNEMYPDENNEYYQH